MLMGGADWMQSVNVMRPYWWVRTFTGIAMDIGISLVVYTLMKTSLPASAPAGVAR
jgi:cytochrome c oxidase cbb3-type subunit 1